MSDIPAERRAPSDALFRPVSPSAEVQAYSRTNPELDLHNALSFLTDTFPPIVDGKLSWLIDGGAAVKLLADAERQVGDIDIITREKDLADKFANSGHFDVKDIRFWLKNHALPETTEAAERVFNGAHEIEFEGNRVWVIQPELLAASKLLLFLGRPSRPQDITDIELLGIPRQEIDRAIAALR